MDGMVMYDELVRRLRRRALNLKEKFSRNAELLSELMQAADAIEELSKPRWIPVTERLPGREWVLCKCRAKIHEVLSLRDGYWYHDPQHQYMSGFVTLWMPLPEPPKEVRNCDY